MFARVHLKILKMTKFVFIFVHVSIQAFRGCSRDYKRLIDAFKLKTKFVQVHAFMLMRILNEHVQSSEVDRLCRIDHIMTKFVIKL